MSKNERQAYLTAIRGRYRRVNKEPKPRFSTNPVPFAAITGKKPFAFWTNATESGNDYTPDVSRSTSHRNC